LPLRPVAVFASALKSQTKPHERTELENEHTERRRKTDFG
jgi:hypothetical protein